MGIVAVFDLAENFLTGQLYHHINLFLVVLCLSEIAELRRAALIEGYDMLIQAFLQNREGLYGNGIPEQFS